MDAVARFAQVCVQESPRLDLGLAAIACAFQSKVTEAQLLARLDELAEGLAAKYRLEMGQDISWLSGAEFSRELFGADGFQGDQLEYSSPSNSLLNEMLDRRRGIPITLTILGIEIGRRCGFNFFGIGMPGHFLMGEVGNSRQFFDPFEAGRVLSAQEAREFFHAMHGSQHTFEKVFLAPAEPRQILMRVLNNLYAAFVNQGDPENLECVLNLQSVIPGYAKEALGQLAGLLATQGRFTDAANVHDRLRLEDPANLQGHERAAQQLRARLN
ncbi:Transglutaminase-like superfamily [Actinobacteria bacterium IMCC26207]|nr:Transglutaminase-like superfamily [Actinobacteria bacterium IMCC26207]